MGKPLRVLIVEDVPDDAELLVLELRRAGYDPVSERVETAAAMRAALEAGRWDLVLSDNSLPQFDAAAALRLLRELDVDLPFIVVSGSIGEDVAVALMKAGAHDYLLKGHLARLGAAVERELREVEGRRERRRATEALRAHREFLRTVIDTSPNLIFAKDWDGRFTLVNKAVAELYGTSPNALLGKSDADFNPSREEVEHFLRDDREVMTSGRSKLIPEEPVTNPTTGETRWFQTVKVPLDGTARQLLGIGTDITSRKRAEEELARALRERETIMEGVPDILYMLDADTRLVRWNRRFEVVAGYAPEALAGRAVLDFIAPDARPLVAEAIMKAFATGYAEVEAELLTADGRTIPYHWTGVPLRDEKGEATGLTGVGRDLTERKRLEQQFRQAQKMEAIGRLAGGIAHDFNNVLTAISGYTELLLEDLGADAPQRGDLEEIRTAAARAGSLTRQLLAFSRQQVLEPRVLDLNDVVAGMDKMLRRILGEDVEVATALAADLGPVKADAGQLEQVILNLAVNARDAMPGGGKLTIETADVELDDAYAREHMSVVPGRYVMLAVSDTGTGMDAETKAKIFEPFFTTKGPGKGTGLGLATVYGIVKQSGGNVWVYSEPGRGATFKVYLPRVDEPVEGPAAVAAPTRPLEGTETILVVEDNESVRRLVRTVLQGHGYTVLESAEPAEALALAGRHDGEIALLVTDVVLPQMNGRELAGQLEAARPGLLVLYISGYTDDAIVNHGVLEVGVAFLQKPFTPAGLLHKVRAVLDSG